MSSSIYFVVTHVYYTNIYTWDVVLAHTPSNPLPISNWGEDVQRVQSLTATAMLTINVSFTNCGVVFGSLLNTSSR